MSGFLPKWVIDPSNLILSSKLELARCDLISQMRGPKYFSYREMPNWGFQMEINEPYISHRGITTGDLQKIKIKINNGAGGAVVLFCLWMIVGWLQLLWTPHWFAIFPVGLDLIRHEKDATNRTDGVIWGWNQLWSSKSDDGCVVVLPWWGC